MICKKTGWFFFLFGVMFLISGCASQKLWYKSGHNQVDFDLDNQDCRMIAEELGRQATITGEKIDLSVFNTSYHNCLFSRGWTHTPPGSEKKTVQTVELARVKENKVWVFDKQVTLPQGFELISNQITGFEDVRLQTLFFQGEGPVFLNMILQQTLSRQFDRIDYPVNDPFFVFEKGEKKAGKDLINWTVFAGEYKGEWVAGIGTYYLVDKNKRISIVMTKAIASPEDLPPPGLRLTKTQKQAVDSFSDQWLGKIKMGI